MFKLIFRAMVITIFLVFTIIGLAMWQGGEPFRLVGEGTIAIGNSLMKFGDVVDEFIEGGKKIGKSYDNLKDIAGNQKDSVSRGKK